MITENNIYTKKWVVVNGIGFEVTEHVHEEIDRAANVKKIVSEYVFGKLINFDQERMYIVCDGGRAVMCYSANGKLIEYNTRTEVLDKRKARFKKFLKIKKGV